MARMSIFKPDMKKLLPAFMQSDEADVALSHAMDELLKVPANRAKILRKWDQIDHMDNAQLDEMAWEFNIDWWDSSFSLETKRSVVKSCYRIHEKRGTKWAVEELIRSAFGVGEVTEWFQYGGEPFYFKIRTNATLTQDGMLYFLNMIGKVKNARSHVEMIETTRQLRQPLHAGTAIRTYSKCTIYDYFQVTRRCNQYMNVGTGRGSYSSRNRITDHFALEYTSGNVMHGGTAATPSQRRNTVPEFFNSVQALSQIKEAGVAQIYYSKNIIKED